MVPPSAENPQGSLFLVPGDKPYLLWGAAGPAQMALRCPKGGEAVHVRLGRAGTLSVVVFKRGATVPQLMGRGLNVVETTSFLTPFPFQVPK